MKIIFICTGNTCRSPMAEGLFRRLLAERGIMDITCDSAGLFANPGDLSTPAWLCIMTTNRSADCSISCERGLAR